MKILLAVEGDGLRFNFALLYVDLVTAQDDRNVLADTDKITLSKISKIIKYGEMDSNIRCQLGTFLYVIREVTSNMMIPHWPLI